MSQLSVLVVDDEKSECELLRDILRLEGHHVEATTKPAQALELFKANKFHLVILDLLMPDISGLDLLSMIRKLDDDVAVVILTGFPSVETASASIPHEVSAYIKKPFEILELRTVIGRIARKKGLMLEGEEELNLAIGRAIRELRKKHGLTLKQTARRTSLSVSLLSQIERAESSASVSSLFKLATAFDVKITALFGDF